MQSKGINKASVIRFLREYTIYVALAVVILFFAITLRGKGFFTPGNALNIIRQTHMDGQTYVGQSILTQVSPALRPPPRPAFSMGNGRWNS